MPRLVFLAILLALAGCGGRAVQPAPERMVRIDWIGNQCYRISSSLGTSILTNPFASGIGGRKLPSPLKADIVLVTSEKPEFNNINAIENQPAGGQPVNARRAHVRGAVAADFWPEVVHGNHEHVRSRRIGGLQR